MRRVSTLVFFAVCLGACVAPRVPREELSDPGAVLFNGYARPEVGCYRCHAGDAKGGSRGPSLAARVPKYDAEKLFDIVRNGHGKMPKYGTEKLTDDELRQVVAWLQATFPR